MNYADARAQIKSGDVLGVALHTPLAAVIRAVQWLGGWRGDLKNTTHTAVAVWLGHRLMLTEMNGHTNAYQPLSVWINEGYEVTVYASDVDEDRAVLAVEEAAASRITYGLKDLVEIGINTIFRTELNWEKDSREVCSSETLNILQDAGWKPVPNFVAQACPALVCSYFKKKFKVEM